MGINASWLTNHGTSCCSDIRTWVILQDQVGISSRQITGNHSGFIHPKWLLDTWKWGPQTWPLAWCEAPNLEYLDCGALAEMAELIFANRGYEVCRVLVNIAVQPQQTSHWDKEWQKQGVKTAHWILAADTIYHEVIAIRKGSNVRFELYDPSQCIFVSDYVSTDRIVTQMILDNTADKEQIITDMGLAYKSDWTQIAISPSTQR